jgi:hypothetical protein
MASEKSSSIHGNSVVNIAFDTNSRDVVLTIDGALTPVTDIFFGKFVFDGEKRVSFAYTVESTNDNGLKERRQFFLPSPEEIAVDAFGKVDERGFASRIVHDDEKAKADIIDYLQRDSKSE